MNEDKEEKYIYHEHKEILLTLTYSILIVFFMWVLSLFIN